MPMTLTAGMGNISPSSQHTEYRLLIGELGAVEEFPRYLLKRPLLAERGHPAHDSETGRGALLCRRGRPEPLRS
ncbi:hypothetical protein D3C86_2018120 [compost metagenome]